MNTETAQYLSLKSIAERFKEVASTITDDEIRSIIKTELREQIHKQVDFGEVISEWVDIWLDDENNAEFVMKCLKESVKERFKVR